MSMYSDILAATKGHQYVLLIDADIICYRSAAAAEQRSYALVDEFGLHGIYESKKEALEAQSEFEGTEIQDHYEAEPVENCLHTIKLTLQFLTDNYPGFFPVIILSGSSEDNFRKHIGISKEYKGHRKKGHKPIHLSAAREYLFNYWGDYTFVSSGMEADDVISVLATHCRTIGVEYVVCTNDKDMKQIPGNHFDWTKNNPFVIANQEAKYHLAMQCLQGDSTDNIPGIHRVGPKSAHNLLEDYEVDFSQEWDDIQDYLIKIYESKGLGVDYALEQIALVSLLTSQQDVEWCEEYMKDKSYEAR